MTDASADGAPRSAVAPVLEMSRSDPTWAATPWACPGGAGITSARAAIGAKPRAKVHAGAAMKRTCRRMFCLSGAMSVFGGARTALPAESGRKPPHRPRSVDGARLAGPVTGPEGLLVDLADRGEREGVDDLHRLGGLVGALLLLDQGHEAAGVEEGAGAGDDDGGDGLAPAVVGDPDHGRGGDVGVGGEDVLHLLGVDVEPPADDHVVLAVDDVDVPLVVTPAHVLGVDPPVPDHLGGQVG